MRKQMRTGFPAKRFPRAFGSGFGIGAAVALSLSGPALADQVIDVSNVTALYNAIAQAEAHPAEYYYIYLAAGTYKLTKPVKITTASVVLVGFTDNPGSAILDGQGKYRAIHVEGSGSTYPYLDLEGVTVQNAILPNSTDQGAGAYVTHGDMDVYACVFRNNASTGPGCGLMALNDYFVNLDYSLIQNNVGKSVTSGACGGGAFTSVGGVALQNGTSNITRSTITGNKQCRIGGIGVLGGAQLWAENNTISQNEGRSYGGGMVVSGDNSFADLRFNTMVENKIGTVATSEPVFGGGLGVWGGASTIYLDGDIIAKNTSGQAGLTNPDDISIRDDGSTYAYLDDWKSLIGAIGNAADWGVTHSMSGTASAPLDPKLNAMGNNGPTSGFALPTYKPQSGSPAVQGFTTLANVTGCPSDDERYYHRANTNGICDIGSIERAGTP